MKEKVFLSCTFLLSSLLPAIGSADQLKLTESCSSLTSLKNNTTISQYNKQDVAYWAGCINEKPLLKIASTEDKYGYKDLDNNIIQYYKPARVDFKDQLNLNISELGAACYDNPTAAKYFNIYAESQIEKSLNSLTLPYDYHSSLDSWGEELTCAIINSGQVLFYYTYTDSNEVKEHAPKKPINEESLWYIDQTDNRKTLKTDDINSTLTLTSTAKLLKFKCYESGKSNMDWFLFGKLYPINEQGATSGPGNFFKLERIVKYLENNQHCIMQPIHSSDKNQYKVIKQVL
ncbi:hypothetical protein [Zooshikella ganghwensis]|nr:hypothetical protein [Zooshikella ganghwensis]